MNKGSVSSVMDSEEEKGYMSIEEDNKMAMKRKQVCEEETDGEMSEEDVATVIREVRKCRERERERRATQQAEKRRKLQAQERVKGKDVEVEVEEEEEEKAEITDEMGEKFNVIDKGFGKILEAVGREVGGKISVTRGDQNMVKEVVYKLQREFIGIMMRQRQVDLKQVEMEKKIERLEKELKKEKMEKSERIGKRDISKGMVISESTSEGEWKETKRGRGQRLSYARVTKGKGERRGENDRIEGRVVVVGKGGWCTPPHAEEEEEAIIVKKGEETDSRKLAKEIYRNMGSKEIGGAPRAVRTLRDGKLVIVPKDKEQGEKIKEGLKKIGDVEIRDRRRAEPLIVISGGGERDGRRRNDGENREGRGRDGFEKRGS